MVVTAIKSMSSARIHASIERNSLDQYVAVCGGIKPWMVVSTDGEVNCKRCLAKLEGGETEESEEPEPTTEKTFPAPSGYGYAHEKCSSCVKAARKAKQAAQELGVQEGEWSIGEHKGVWKKA